LLVHGVMHMLLAPLGDRFQAPSEPFAHCPYVHCELPSSAACTDVRQTHSWAGVCPGNNESAGKRKSARIPNGNVYLKTALVEAAKRRDPVPGELICATSSAALRGGAGINGR